MFKQAFNSIPFY